MEQQGKFTPLTAKDWLFVTVLSPGAAPGDEVTCELCMNLTDALTFDAITLAIEGDEKSGIEHETLTPDHKKIKEFLFDKNQFFNVSALLSAQSTLKPGQYKYTTKLKLPVHIPPSFLHTTKSTFHRIRYTLIGTVKTSDLPPFKATFPLFVYPARPTTDAPLSVRETQQMKRLCSSAPLDDSVMFAVRAPSAHFDPAVPLTFAVDVCNDTNHQLKVNVSLHQMLTMQAKRQAVTLKEEMGRCQLVNVNAHEAYQGRMVSFTLSNSLSKEPTLNTDASACAYILRVAAERKILGSCGSPVVLEVPLYLTPRPSLDSHEWSNALSLRYPKLWKPVELKALDQSAVDDARRSVAASVAAAGRSTALAQQQQQQQQESAAAASKPSLEERKSKLIKKRVSVMIPSLGLITATAHGGKATGAAEAHKDNDEEDD